MNFGINPFHLAQVSFGRKEIEPQRKSFNEQPLNSSEADEQDEFVRTTDEDRPGYRPTYKEVERPDDDTFVNHHGYPSLCVGECQ